MFTALFAKQTAIVVQQRGWISQCQASALRRCGESRNCCSYMKLESLVLQMCPHCLAGNCRMHCDWLSIQLMS